MNALILVFPLAAAVVITGLCLQSRATPEAPLTPLPPAQVIPAPDVAAPANGQPHAPAASPTKIETPAPTTAVTTFADGSKLPTLNGVTEALTMPWPGGGQFSPVLEVITHQGQQWYRHQDGSMSTTLVTRDEVSGKPVTVPMCCRPEPVMKALQRARR